MSADTSTVSPADRAAELLNEGRRLMGLRRAHEAIPLFNQAYELAPDNTEIRFQIGSVARLQGDLPLALQHKNYCLEKSPERPEVWLRLGETLSYSRRRTRASPSYSVRCSAMPTTAGSAGAMDALGKIKAAAKLLTAVSLESKEELLRISASALLATLNDDEQETETSRRVAFHMKASFHEAVLKPGWEAARKRHKVLLTLDVEEVLAHRPDAIVACDSQLVSMRRLAPEATYINTRHGLIF